MKPIAPCFLGLFLLLGPAFASSAQSPEVDGVDESARHDAQPVDRHSHHSFFALFQRHSGPDTRCTRFLSAPLFSVFRSERWGDQRDLRILSLPIIGSLYRHRVVGNHHRREFLFLIDIETEN